MVPVDLTPLTNRVRRLLVTRHRHFRELSASSRQLCPAETAVAPEAVFLKSDLDRVTGVQAVTSLEHEMHRIAGGATEHQATVAHRLRDVRLLDGHLYRGAMKHRLSSARGRLAALGGPDVVGAGALACSLYGNTYFGHFMRDDLTMQLAATELAAPFTSARESYTHEPGYRALFELPAHPLTHAHFRELVILEDNGQNRYKRQRYRTLRERLARAVKPAGAAGAYIRRGSSGARRLLTNEQAVEAFFVDAGFTVVDPATMTVDDMTARMAGVPIVAGVEGSQIAHGYFAMADDGAVLVLQPPYRFNNVIKDFTDCVGLTYAFVVGREDEGGFEIELDGLARVIDLLTARRERLAAARRGPAPVPGWSKGTPS